MCGYEKGQQAISCSILASREVDEWVNAVFTAMTTDLGRPFTAGRRNVRSVVQGWCPLSQGLPDLDIGTFRSSYISSHFFDRYFYHSELKAKRDLELEALEKFKDNLVRGHTFASGIRDALSQNGQLRDVFRIASYEIQKILGEFSLIELFERAGHGPNSTIGVKKELAYLDRKYSSLDGTLPAHSLFRTYVGWNTNLRSWYKKLYAEGKPPSMVECVGNRLSFVPKKFDSLRSMMIEPGLNQFFQLGLGRMIQNRLKLYGNIDLETQAMCHAKLVQVVTAHDLDIATIDWSQASDRIWLSLCQLLLPSDWYAAIEDCRSPLTTYGSGDKAQTFELTMAGTMGCGFTFPLMTLLFTVLLRTLGYVSGKSEFVSVFGDDCICDSDLLPEIEWLAGVLDWKLNVTKSFSTGGFRESCGVDAYRGSDCRPFFIERPDNVSSKAALAAWAYGVFNQTHAAMHAVWFGSNLSNWLTSFLSRIGYRHVLYVPPRFSVNAGVRVNSPRDQLAGAPTTVAGNSAVGYEFKSIGQKRELMDVDQEPFYLWKLTGNGVPQEFKKGVTPDELEDLTVVDPGRVPAKTRRYGVRKRYVHTWHYLTPLTDPNHFSF